MNRIYRNIKAIADFKKFISEKSVSVVGIAVSNLQLIKFLKKCGVQNISARDKKNIFDSLELLEKDIKELTEKEKLELKELEELKNTNGIKFIFGENYLEDLNEDIIFKTPGIRRDLEPFERAENSGRVVTSEIELFFALCPAKTIAITGSEGKTTTTTIIGKILESANKRVFVGGNIGAPLIGKLEEMTEEDYAVAELSSFQLFDLYSDKVEGFGNFAPDYSVITNITPNHLDWHKDMVEYSSAKKIIFKNQVENQRVILNYDCEIVSKLADEVKSEVYFFAKNRLPENYKNGVFCENGEIFIRTNGIESKIMNRSDIFIRGEHNVQNFMAAVGATHEIADVEAVKRVAESFNGVEHRIEFVRESNGVSYYNSSIDSSPTRTIAALKNFDDETKRNNGEKNIVVILGGYDKKIAFDPLVPVVREKAKAAVLYGDTREKIRKSFEKDNVKEVNLVSADSFDMAVAKAHELAESGDIVLLSPACASFDCFKNFEARGNRFKEIVRGF